MIEIKNIKKNFGKLTVLDDISFNIEKGKTTAILGPNGSGKTTIIKIILGLTKQSSGNILVNSENTLGNFMYRGSIGYMPQIAKYPENLKVKDVLYMIKDLRGDKYELDNELYECFEIDKYLSKKIHALSGGMKQRVSAVIAFMFSPKILILDEPTAGLDPISSSLLKDKINKEKSNGKTVILTSHIMSEIEELSDNIVFLLDGNIMYDGAVESLTKNGMTLERTVANLMKEGIS